MRIGIDFDGVICDSDRLKSKAAKELYGLDIPPSLFRKELLFSRGILTPSQYKDLKKEVYENRQWMASMIPFGIALESLSRLIRDGHDITIITARDGDSMEIAREWLQSHGINVPFIGTGYGNSKAMHCRNLDIYLDDDIEKLRSLASIVPHRFLFTNESNKGMDIDTHIAERVSSWDHFCGIIEQLAQMK